MAKHKTILTLKSGALPAKTQGAVTATGYGSTFPTSVRRALDKIMADPAVKRSRLKEGLLVFSTETLKPEVDHAAPTTDPATTSAIRAFDKESR